LGKTTETATVGFPALDVRWTPDASALSELLHATLYEFEPQAIQDSESADGWRVFFRTAPQRNGAVEALRTSFGDRLTSIEAIDVPDDDWARRSQADLKAVRVGRIIVAPPWDPVGGQGSEAGGQGSHPAAPASGLWPPAPEIVIIIDPSTGFGTGHHETTRLCLALLQEIDLTGKSVIDVGTGSSVLALAAWKLGASRVVAFDDDPEALRNAVENVGRNRAVAVELCEADLASFTTQPADVVMANLTGAVLQRHAGRLRGLVKREGSLLISGFSPDEERDVAGGFGGRIVRLTRAGEWAAALIDVHGHL
jgi:ribosomal protein L11 methyltransferase